MAGKLKKERDMGKTKEEKKARREAKVAEWLAVFVRAYEIARAYGTKIDKAVIQATEETNEYMNKDWRAIPQDRSFFVDCRMEMETKLKEAVYAAERRAHATV